MTDFLDKEINVEEIMERIKEEVSRRGRLPIHEPPLSQESLLKTEIWSSQPPPVMNDVVEESLDKKGSFDQFLWKYGKRYKKIIKAVPILKTVARKQHRRLIYKFMVTSPQTQPIYSSPVNIDCLPYYINYHGFLEQAKEREGLKGLLKYHLFKFIRFFAWWQEQINRALYQELMAQKARMDEKERWVQELHNQQIHRLIEELRDRDNRIEDLNKRQIIISQAKEELSRRLSDQEVKIVEAEKGMERALHRQRAQFVSELSERDKAIDRLNNQLIQLGEMEEIFNQKMIQQKERLDAIEREAKELYRQGVEGLRLEWNKRLNELGQSVESIKEGFSHLIKINSSIDQMRKELEDQKTEITGQRVRLATLFEETKEQFENLFKEENELPEEVYVAFENRFRGTREEIKERLKVYLPYIHQAQLGDDNFRALDLGSGRGEWLELIKRNGYMGRGVDINRVMVRQCQELGLDVVESDMIDYLKKQESNSFGMVTGFHILEHLSIGRIVSLLDEVLRVLKPGGVAIFETPNPENLLVATCHFYLDPTHRHSLPSELVSFLLESRGFKKVEIVRRHPFKFIQEGQEASPSVNSLLSLFNREQDYSAIAYKE